MKENRVGEDCLGSILLSFFFPNIVLEKKSEKKNPNTKPIGKPVSKSALRTKKN